MRLLVDARCPAAVGGRPSRERPNNGSLDRLSDDDCPLASARDAPPVSDKADRHDLFLTAAMAVEHPACAVLSVVHVTDSGEHVPTLAGVVDGVDHEDDFT